MRIAETVSVYFTQGFWILAVYERVGFRNSVVTVRAILSGGIDPDDGAPDIFRTLVDMKDAPLRTSAVADADVQESVVFVTAFRQRVEGDLLHAVRLANHVYPEELAARSLEGKCGR